MAQVQLGTDQGIQLTLSSALPPNAEAPRSPSALRHDAEARINRLLDFLTKRSAVGSGSVSTYKASKSTGSENQYFRYTYRVAGKQKSKSIPGGNIRSRLAQHRAQMVKEAIIAGKSSHEIVYLIGSFKHSK